MHSFTFSAVLLSASLASGVLASANIPRALLQVRQGGDAFIPGTRTGFGATCIDAFGPNSKLCANSGTCYDFSIGDSCCSEGYPCGTGSYCLVKGYCCPNVCSTSPPPLKMNSPSLSAKTNNTSLHRPAPPPNAHLPTTSASQLVSPSKLLKPLVRLLPPPSPAHPQQLPLPKPLPPPLPLSPPPPALHRALPSPLEAPPSNQDPLVPVLATPLHPLPRLAHHPPLSNPSPVVPQVRRLLVAAPLWPSWLLPVPWAYSYKLRLFFFCFGEYHTPLMSWTN